MREMYNTKAKSMFKAYISQCLIMYVTARCGIGMCQLQRIQALAQQEQLCYAYSKTILSFSEAFGLLMLARYRAVTKIAPTDIAAMNIII